MSTRLLKQKPFIAAARSLLRNDGQSPRAPGQPPDRLTVKNDRELREQFCKK